MARTLPEYRKPPINEVVCGVLFKSIDSLLAPHLGLFWQKLKPNYITCQEVTPLAPIIESMGPPESSRPLEITDLPPLPRIWFIEQKGNGVIQVQRDRFLHNWRRLKPDDEYPRYGAVFSAFEKHLSEFEEFLGDHTLAGVSPLQYELNYVNHILQGDGWETLDDIGRLFPDFSWRVVRGRPLAKPETVNWRISFMLPGQMGRLHVSIRNATRRDDGHSLFYLGFTARGIGKDSSREATKAWFDLAHESIVLRFADLTGEEVQSTVWDRVK